MSVLPQLERDLTRAAERRLAAPARVSDGAPGRVLRTRGAWRHRRIPRTGKAWRHRRVTIALAFAALTLIGAGGGALLLAPGKPLTPASELPAMSTVGIGRPLAPSLAPLALRVADPGGGLPWAMRVIRTTRGLACIQAGRVLDGHIGAIGIGYAFKGDGRFHPFAAADAISEDGCATVDRDGLAFQPGAPALATADGATLAGENVWPGERAHCDLPGEMDWGVRCPRADLREIAVGLLGPDAQSIRVETSGRRFSVTPAGRDGAYLIVLPAPAGSTGAGGGGDVSQRGVGVPSRVDAMARLTVTYRDGSQCRIPAFSQVQQCTPKGLETATGVSRRGLRAALHVSYRPRLPYSPPLLAEDAGGRTFHGPGLAAATPRPGPGLVVSFTAPAAAPSVSSGYDVELRSGPASGCAAPATIVAQPTQQTLVAGARVQISVSLESNCATVYSGRVFLASSSGSYSEARTADRAGEGPLYEVIASYFCCGRRRVKNVGSTVGDFRVSVP
jgi:hypothetical protein